MIEILSIALGLIVHALRVQLERLVRSINGNRNGSNGGHSLGHFLLITLGYIDKAAICGTNGALVEVAGVINTLIGVRFLGINATIVLDVTESIVHQATVAAIVAVLGGAINQILLGQRYQGTGLAEMLTLQSASRREGPAATAMSLILNLRNGTLGTPIHRLGQCNRRRRDEGDSRKAGISGTARMTRINLYIVQKKMIVQLTAAAYAAYS